MDLAAGSVAQRTSRRGVREAAWQQIVGWFGHDRAAPTAIKAHDQADPQAGTAHLVPGDPDAVGVPDLGPAVMLGKLFRGDHVFAQRLLPLRVEIVTVKGIDG